jgi:hypothetical protein
MEVGRLPNGTVLFDFPLSLRTTNSLVIIAPVFFEIPTTGLRNATIRALGGIRKTVEVTITTAKPVLPFMYVHSTIPA